MRQLICVTFAALFLPALLSAQEQSPAIQVPDSTEALCFTSAWSGLEAPLTIAAEGGARVVLGAQRAGSALVNTPAVVLVPRTGFYRLSVISRIPNLKTYYWDCTPTRSGGPLTRDVEPTEFGGLYRRSPPQPPANQPSPRSQ